jgi:hypothetical protein
MIGAKRNEREVPMICVLLMKGPGVQVMILIYYLCVGEGRHLNILLNPDGDCELAFLHRHWRRMEMNVVETEN